MSVIDHYQWVKTKKFLGKYKDELGANIIICCFKTKNLFILTG